MTWTKLSSRRVFALLLMLILLLSISSSQWLGGNLKDPNNRADYLIIAPSLFVPAIQPLAAHRASHNSFSVAIILTDSIYAQFPTQAPDSSIRAFLTYAHSFWRKPAPSYLLIAGNTTTVPTHMEASYFSDFGEDSVATDEWYVDTLSTNGQAALPTSAIGRFPAWNPDELSVMVAKTIQYETTSPFPHADRFITVADSEFSSDFFENEVQGLQALVSPVWKDTVAIAVRTSSAQHRSRSEFLNLWNEGTAAVDFRGAANNVQFSHSKYFTSADIDSLREGSSLTVCIFESSQRFQKADTVAMAVNLLRANDRGAAAVLVSTGHMYGSANGEFSSAWRHSLAAEPSLSFGVAVKLAKQTLLPSEVLRRETLLGDPALVIQHTTTAGITPPPAEPSSFQLSQNYPNPFNPSTAIKYTVGVTSGGWQVTGVKLAVYDLLGREVTVLVDERKAPGSYEVSFDGSGLASGMYIYRFIAGSFVQSRTMLLVK